MLQLCVHRVWQFLHELTICREQRDIWSPAYKIVLWGIKEMYLNIGIDVAKSVHEACILDDEGKQVGKHFRIKNSKSSIEKFRERVESVSNRLNSIPRIGMEATGIYWCAIYSELSKHYEIHAYNPSQVRRFAAVNVRGSKIDAKTIAAILRFGEASKTCYGNKTRMELKEYCRFYFKLKSNVVNLKKRLIRNIHLIFPGYDQMFSSIFTKNIYSHSK